LTIVSVLAIGAAFARWMTIALLVEILQPLIVALSIMAAGLLVRLNRGMPTLDWKSLSAAERKVLTQKVVELTREYLVVLSVLGLTLAFLLLVVLNKATQFSERLGISISALAGALLALCVSRMAYIVWRDMDIVRLQKKLIDDSADRDAIEAASREALTKVNAIRSSGLRDAAKPEPKQWSDN
jgi:hypothetical protein